MKSLSFLVPVGAALLVASGAVAQTAPTAPGRSLSLTSQALTPGGEIPTEFTCEGKRRPPLAWSSGPEGTQSFAIVLVDQDAHPRTASRLFIHWIVYNLPPQTSGLNEGAQDLPVGATQGQNDFGNTGYGGPCPPSKQHHYVWRLYALDTRLALSAGPASYSELEGAIAGHVLASGELSGTYQRRAPK